MKICIQCKSPFEITDADKKLYAKFGMEPAGLCFECDHKNRVCFRNERILYKRKCDFSGSEMVSIYSQDKPYKVFRSDIWYGDKWDPMEYGMDFDFNRPFFEQFKELQLKVPRLALINVNGENSEYCNMSAGNKDSYLVFGGDFNDWVLYGTLCMHNKDSVDIDISERNQLCYMMCDSNDCYGCRFTFDSKNCKDCSFISDCVGCSECILCTNLHNKSYCIQNRQYPKEEYFSKKKEILNGSYATQKSVFDIFKSLLKNRIVKYSHSISCQDCSGDYLNNCKNCVNCYDTAECEDVKDSIMAVKAKNCFKVNLIGHDSENSYNSITIIGTHSVRSSYFVFNSSDIDYSEQIVACGDCFGCNGLRHKKNCLLNKQYSKSEYEKLKEKIVTHMKKTGEWGKFFPKELSCFAYNESTAHQYYPLTKEQAIGQGYKWKDRDKRDYLPQSYVVPDRISGVSDDIIDATLACETCKINYKIAPQELKFYKTNNIPVPRNCSECRHKIRLSLRNPRKLYGRKCQNCGIGFQTTYSPERPEKVYCEACYLKEVY